MQPTMIPHIEIRADKCDGRPCIQGTRIRVHDIYVWHVLGGQSAVDILANKPELSLASIHAAISYIFDHREEIERDIADENAAFEQLRLTAVSKVAAKLQAANGSNQVSS